jgi:hemerythrin
MTDLLVWKSEYCIGEDTIDAEHQNLFHLANEVFKVKMSESKIDNIGPLIHKLYEYMKYHFDHEEVFMVEISFNEIDFHKTKHLEIIAEMNAIMKSSHQITVLADKLAAMMVKWVLKHILEEDIKIKSYLR